MSALAEPQTELMRQHAAREAARANIRARGEAFRIKRERDKMEAENQRRTRSKPVIRLELYEHHIGAMKVHREALYKAVLAQKEAPNLYREVITPQTNHKPRTSRLEIALTVARKHNITVAMLKSPMSNRPVAWPRQEFCYLAAKAGLWSIPRIGEFINRDHTTVLYSVNGYCYRNDLIHPTTGEKVTAEMARVVPKKNGGSN